MSEHIIPRRIGETAEMAFERHGVETLAFEEARFAERHHPPDVYCHSCRRVLATIGLYCDGCSWDLDGEALRHRVAEAANRPNVEGGYVAHLLSQALDRLEVLEAEIAELRKGE